MALLSELEKVLPPGVDNGATMTGDMGRGGVMDGSSTSPRNVAAASVRRRRCRGECDRRVLPPPPAGSPGGGGSVVSWADFG